MGAGASASRGAGPFSEARRSSAGIAADSANGDGVIQNHETKEILLEASHLSEGDILRMYSYVNSKKYDLDSRFGVLKFLQEILQQDSLMPFCERLLLRQNPALGPGNAASSVRVDDAHLDLDSREIVTGLWNFLTMDHTGLTAFLFSLYETDGNGLTHSALESMLSDLHGAQAGHTAAAVVTKQLQHAIASAEGASSDGSRVQWAQFHEVLKDGSEFLQPLFQSQDKVRHWACIVIANLVSWSITRLYHVPCCCSFFAAAAGALVRLRLLGETPSSAQ